MKGNFSITPGELVSSFREFRPVLPNEIEVWGGSSVCVRSDSYPGDSITRCLIKFGSHEIKLCPDNLSLR